MKVSQFMNHALFDDDHGYYRTKNPIGKDADFITAPEVSQVFGELLAAYLIQISSTNNQKIALVEMGAGKGTLFKDVLLSILKLADKKIPQAVDFFARTTFNIIEINKVLREVQKENLQGNKIFWYRDFEEFVANISSSQLFFFSNELFDCFPIDQFVKTDIGWCERLVDQSQFITAKFNPETHAFVENLIGFEASQLAPLGAVFEYSKSAQDFIMQLCKALQEMGGIAINFDYGYIKNEFANTLQAIKNHQKTNVLENVGSSDITALVDFSALAKIVKNSGLNSSLISQSQFLISLGIEERRKALLSIKSGIEREKINLAIDRLINSGQMGELFKCLIIWK